IESVKAASDINAPLSGVVAEVNSDLENNPGIINKDPLANGWLFKVNNIAPADLDDLMDETAYQAFLMRNE
ncbi:MAG: glycine cleavage system protein H, partial [Chitinivibrionales bacterium]|nr:glycine cleavage system protein H [Chitinivibrionales bacterium]